MKPLISVIIINWNGGAVFENCLISLSKISYKPWELIVADNASTDNSLELVKKYISNAKIIKNKFNLGFATANNQAVKLAKGEYLLLLNNDTKVKPDLLDVLEGRIELDPEMGVIQPKIKIMDRPEFLDNAGSFITKIGFLDHWGFLKRDSPEFDNEKYIFSAKGACMLIRASVIKKVGLFDNDFFSYFEESDFCWRVWLSGYKVLYYPKTYIYHKLGFTIKRLNVEALNYHNYKNRIASQIKNLSLANLILILIPHLFISLVIALTFFLKGKIGNFLMVVRAIFWNIINLPNLIKKRKAVQKLRKTKDSYIFNLVGTRINWGKFYNDLRRIEKDISKG